MSIFTAEGQKRGAWCWAAASSTVSNYFDSDHPISQCEIAKTVCDEHSEDCCREGSDLCNEGKSLDDVFRVVSETLKRPLQHRKIESVISFMAVRDQLRAGYPVCARVQWFEGGGHAVIISGYSIWRDGSGWLRISDPLYKSPLMPYSVFRDYYRGSGRWTHTYVVSPLR